MGAWQINFHPKVAEDLKQNVAKKDISFILETIDKRLSEEPEKIGKQLRHDLSDYRRIRISKYRVIYQIQKYIVTVFVLTVDRREDVYSEVFKRLGV